MRHSSDEIQREKLIDDKATLSMPAEHNLIDDESDQGSDIIRAGSMVVNTQERSLSASGLSRVQYALADTFLTNNDLSNTLIRSSGDYTEPV